MVEEQAMGETDLDLEGREDFSIYDDRENKRKGV